LDLSPDAVRRLARVGKLVADEETPSGVRLFRRSTLEAFAEERRRHPETRGRPRKVAKKISSKKTRTQKRRTKTKQ
jgi:hypothetical protein